MTLAISGHLDIDAILDRVVRLSIELIGADAGSLPLYDEQRDVLLPSYMVNLDVSLSVHYRGTGTVWDQPQLISLGAFLLPLLSRRYHPPVAG